MVCCSLAGTKACQSCQNNPYATNIRTNTVVVTDKILYTNIKTNADKIRSMSDEELARLLSTTTACYRCEVKGCSGGHLNCYDIWVEWLKQERSDEL